MPKKDKPRRLTLTVPFPPSVNAAYKTLVVPKKKYNPGTGKFSVYYHTFRAKSKVAKEYHKSVGSAIKCKQLQTFGDLRLKVVVVLHEADNRKRDLANFDKILLDTIVESGLISDDSNIDDYRFIRGKKMKPPRAVVVIEAIPDKQMSFS